MASEEASNDLVRDLESFLSDNRENWINTLVAIGRDLAETAITDANVAGTDPGKIAKALEDLATGDADAARGSFDKAIWDYRKAWNGLTGCNSTTCEACGEA